MKKLVAPTDDELYRVAVHELGHAVASEMLREHSVSHITIAPRGNALGFVRQVPEADSYLYTKDQLDQQIMVALGGAVAEELIFHTRSTGAQNDFMQAGRIARTEVVCGLSRIGIVAEDHLQDNILDEEVRFILSELEDHTQNLLAPFKEMIEPFARTLVNCETVDGESFRKWLYNPDSEFTRQQEIS